MEGLRFIDLCIDVKKSILDYISRPTDLKSLCLTCKDLQNLAAPRLYRDMRLFLGGDQDRNLLRHLADGNPGFPHIRKIHVHADLLVPQNDHERSTTFTENSRIMAQAQDTLCLILEQLPESTLEYCEWLIARPLSVSTLLLLCNKQKSLTNLYLMPTAGPLFPELQKNPSIFRQMTSLSSVCMYPNTIDMLQACGKLLCDSSSLKDLIIANEFQIFDEAPDDLYDSSTHLGLYTRTMFSHLQPFDRCTPMVPKNLGLEGVDLLYSPETWLKVIDFTVLRILELYDCLNAHTVFDNLSKRSPSLKSIEWKDACSVISMHALESFEKFLYSFLGLETIDVQLGEVKALPTVSAILNHQMKFLGSYKLFRFSLLLMCDARDSFTKE